MVVVGKLVFFDEGNALRGAAKVQKTLPRAGVHIKFNYNEQNKEYHVPIVVESEELRDHVDNWLRELSPANFPGLTHVELPGRVFAPK
jgi:hypothetical protein